ncbi:MAG: carboxypeptidase regulatory-like domain-containing protein [Bacteroidota bacterium]
MKKFTLLVLLLLGIFTSGQVLALTVNISGTVTNISNGAPIANHTVYINSDSSGGFYYYNTVQTNTNGFYTVSIPNVNPNDTVMFLVQTQDCSNVWHNQNVSGNMTPITVNFQICVGPPPALTVTISGTVYQTGTTIPIPNHAVNINADSNSNSYNYSTTAYTNSSGYYTVTITNVPNNIYFVVSTLDCNNAYHSQTVNGNNTPITVNFYLCVGTPPPTGNLWGIVYAGTNIADHARVDLIHSVNDSLFVVDSRIINDSGAMFSFYGVPTGNYMLMAELLESSNYYGDYLPTFYVASIYWTGATIIQQGDSTNQYDIHLVAVQGYAPGTGNITGNIQQGTISPAGIPIPNMEVLLLDQNNQPLAYTKTDVNGNFSFSNIAFGTYIVYPQKLDVNTTPSTVTLTSGNPNANLIFFMSNGTIYMGIGHHHTPVVGMDVNIYPNPVMEKGTILLTSSADTELGLTIYEMTGKTVSSSMIRVNKGENQIDLPSAGLATGVYYLKVISSDGSSVARKFIVKK